MYFYRLFENDMKRVSVIDILSECKSKIQLLMLVLIGPFMYVQAQVGETPNLVRNEDGSVTFRYEDAKALSMKIICDCELRRKTTTVQKENYHSAKMVRDSSGWWTYTTPPLVPEVYTYQFERNGITRFPDPENPDSLRVHNAKMSGFIIAGTPQTDLYIVDTLHGRLDTLVFQSVNEEKPRRVVVYTPPQYSENQEEYPVLYLLHGLNGNELAWNERGRATQILDNLIVQKKAKPMIMVMPDANPVCLIAQKEDIGLGKNILLYPTWKRREFEKCYPEMDTFLMEKYRFSTREGSRAVAGLSAGGKQAANLANMYCGTFSSVGMFSPVVGHRQVPDSCYTRYWIGGGTGDPFHRRINKFRKRIQRSHVYYTMYNSCGGHTWRNWRVYFTDYVQTLFWNL